MRADWEDLVDDFGYTINAMEAGGFLVMRALVGLNPNPYAQVARVNDGSLFCEVVSALHVPEEIWPIDEFFLVLAGWDPPIGCRTTWARTVESGDEAARVLISALRFGRACPDPDSYVGTLSRWPPSDPPASGAPFDLAA